MRPPKPMRLSLSWDCYISILMGVVPCLTSPQPDSLTSSCAHMPWTQVAAISTAMTIRELISPTARQYSIREAAEQSRQSRRTNI